MRMWLKNCSMVCWNIWNMKCCQFCNFSDYRNFKIPWFSTTNLFCFLEKKCHWFSRDNLFVLLSQENEAAICYSNYWPDLGVLLFNNATQRGLSLGIRSAAYATESTKMQTTETKRNFASKNVCERHFYSVRTFQSQLRFWLSASTFTWDFSKPHISTDTRVKDVSSYAKHGRIKHHERRIQHSETSDNVKGTLEVWAHAWFVLNRH